MSQCSNGSPMYSISAGSYGPGVTAPVRLTTVRRPPRFRRYFYHRRYYIPYFRAAYTRINIRVFRPGPCVGTQLKLLT